MAKASTRARNDKEPRKRGRPPKKKFQPTKPRPQPILKKLSTSELSAATVPGGSSSAPDVGVTVAASKSTNFDENTATALLLGLARPVGDSEVPDPVGEYSIEGEDFFQNLKESETGGLDDEHSQLEDEDAILEKLERQSLEKLCLGETCEKAHAILRLATTNTGPGSGCGVIHPSAFPGICAYLASEELDNDEVSYEAAIASACISQKDFTTALGIVRKALVSEARLPTWGFNYSMLIDTYRVAPAKKALDWMHVVENTIPNNLRMLRTLHRTSTVTCAIFYWICQIMKVKGVQETSLCQHCSIPLLAFKSVMTALDKKCDVIASRIKSQLQKMNSSEAPSTRPSTSPPKSPSKSVIKAKSHDVTSSKPLTKKRDFAAMSHSTTGDLDDILLPEVPTKRILIRSPGRSKPTTMGSQKSTCTASVAEFVQAINGDPTPRHEQQKPVFSIAIYSGSHSPSPQAGPTTLRCTRSHPSGSAEESVSIEVDEQRAGLTVHIHL